MAQQSLLTQVLSPPLRLFLSTDTRLPGKSQEGEVREVTIQADTKDFSPHGREMSTTVRRGADCQPQKLLDALGELADCMPQKLPDVLRVCWRAC